MINDNKQVDKKYRLFHITNGEYFENIHDLDLSMIIKLKNTHSCPKITPFKFAYPKITHILLKNS